MSALETIQIAVIAAAKTEAAAQRADALRRAGATVRLSTPDPELWSMFGSTTLDALVVLLEPNDAVSMALFEQLQGDSRTRDIPMLLLAERVPSTAQPATLVLSDGVDDTTFVQAISSLSHAMRRAGDAEQRERLVRSQLQAELKLSERRAREMVELFHELRTMLGPILDYSCNLRDGVAGPLSTDQASHVRAILEAVEGMTRLLEKKRRASLSAMRRVTLTPEAPPARLQRTLVSLAGIAADVVSLFEKVALRNALRLECTADDGVYVWGDAPKLKQALANLVVNAIKYTPRGGEVSVRVAWHVPNTERGEEARRMAEMAVLDTGPGIPVEHREAIFVRGFRLHGGEVAGEGIGLAVVKEVVTQHGGAVSVDHAPGGGSVFRLVLPSDLRRRARPSARGVTVDNIEESAK